MGRDVHLFSIFFILLASSAGHSDDAYDILNDLTTRWADELQRDLIKTSDFVTRRATAKEKYESTPLEERNDGKVSAEIAENIKAMMDMKAEAVKRIMEIAENASEDAKDEEAQDTYMYYNAKCLVQENASKPEEPCSNQTMTADLSPHPHFWNVAVNTSFSAVHVPTNVYDRARDVLKPIKWSEELDHIFRSNYESDPSLSWQYFGSSTGFMRQYPALEWKMHPVDMYDCRTRAWYIEAASSPKDIIILIDFSGSMTGIRKEIARHVVDEILDTLGNNDYVNILHFSETVKETIPCFENRLVQANLANVRAFKQSLAKIDTKNIANFSAALDKAFNILTSYREDERPEDIYSGAHCNQAIMLITDGVPLYYKEFFNNTNWPDMPVRMFTYLVGREVTDTREIQWMACANRGYYVHLSTQAEVREQVLQYIPVMARPLVLNKSLHPVIWTPVYADITDPKMTDWIWEKKEFGVQRQYSLQQKTKRLLTRDPELVEYLKTIQEVDPASRLEYKLMTSVSVPVFDKRDNANITERVLLNEAVWVDQTTETVWVRESVESLEEKKEQKRIAALLGVAGTDVPISEISKLMNPFKLGVGGYAFVVTNNGYILYHPDQRPVYKGLLKPNYNSVDMIEIEIPDDNREPREFNHQLLRLRDIVVNGTNKHVSEVMRMKFHVDNLRRVGITRRRYYIHPIQDSPFTLVTSVPLEYGNHEVHGQLELRRLLSTEENIAAWFGDRKWRLHPDWVYCKYLNESVFEFSGPEDKFCHFLSKASRPGWNWHSYRANHHATNSTSGKKNKSERKEAHYCDRDLFLSLLYDAKATEWFNDNVTDHKNMSLTQILEKFGVKVAFIATRTGLTRWQEIGNDDRNYSRSFGDLHPKAIDETWYRRAVDYYLEDPTAYVYSVPFDALNKSLVTVSHAIYVQRSDTMRAPAVVVGYQFQLEAFHQLFFNVTANCPNNVSCDYHCSSPDVACYIIDNNGYVIVSENTQHSGVFFGELSKNVMRELERDGIFRRIRFYDYQAVCFKLKDPDAIAGAVSKTGVFFTSLFRWALGNFISILSQLGFSLAQIAPPSISDAPEIIIEEEVIVEEGNATFTINKTRPESCDQEMDLFILQKKNISRLSAATFRRDELDDCNKPSYIVKPLVQSNLILVVVNQKCVSSEYYITTRASEVLSYNDTLICHKYHSNMLSRRRPQYCISRHEKEKEIDMCGRGSTLFFSNFLLCLVLLFQFCYHGS